MAGRVGLLLCRVPPEAAAQLGALAPGSPALVGERLCAEPAHVRRWARAEALEAAVLAACRDSCQERLGAALAALGPFALHVVGPDARGDAARLAALAHGKLRRALAGAPTPPEGVRYRLPLDGPPVDRRRLLAFPLRGAATPLPLVDAAACRVCRGCRRCVAACPLEALGVAAGRIQLDRGRCEGCGCCLTACPAGALRLPGISLAAVLAEVRGVLAVAGAPRIALFHCAGAVPAPAPPATFPVVVPCVGMLSLPWLLGPLAEGAAGVLVWARAAGCRPWHPAARVRAMVSLAQAVLEGLGVSPTRLAAVDAADAVEAAAARLAGAPAPAAAPGFVPADGAGPGSAPPARSTPAPVPADPAVPSRARAAGEDPPTPDLAAILRRLASPDDGSRRPLAGEALPFGVLEVDRARCALCGVCAGVCPTGALGYEEDARGARLTVLADRCDGCRACAAACPEGALAVRRELRLAELGVARLLHRGAVVRCRRCGAVVAPASLLRAVRVRLGTAPAATGLFRYCIRCRLAAGLQAAPATAPRAAASRAPADSSAHETPR